MILGDTPGKIANSLVLGIVLLGIATLSSAYGDTVLWHHSDEKAPGEATESSDVLANSVSAEYGSGKAYYMNDANGLGADPDFMPVYANPLPCMPNVVLDPVSGAVFTNGASMRFRTAGTTSALKGGGIIIGDDEAFRLANYTVECFVCTTGGTFNTIAPIVGKIKTSNSTFSDSSFMSESWQIGLLSNGKIFMRYSGGTSSTAGDGTHSITDGQWHHIALTCSYDESSNKSTYKIYVDYKLDFTKTKDEATAYGTSGHNEIFVGGYCHSGRKFNGQIDELRISDTALTPDGFLRISLPPFIDDDTIAWIPFDGAGVAMTDKRQNMLFGTASAILAKMGSVPDAVYSNDTVSAKLQVGHVGKSSWDNPTSLFVQTNGTAGSGSCINLSSYQYTATNFTAELFFKTAGRVATVESQTLLKISTTPYVQLTFDKDHAGKLMLVYGNANNGSTSAQQWTNGGYHGSDLDDGNWHHVAVTYDYGLSSLKLYIDYIEKTSIGGVRLPSANSTGCVGARTGGDAQFFHGWIDSVRLTKKTLEPSSFLAAHSGNVYPVQADTVFYLPLDANLEAFSGGVLVNGNGFAHADGDLPPSFSPEVRYAEVMHDSPAGNNVETNRGSAFFSGSTVFFPAVYGLGAYDQTAELFCKLSSVPHLAGIVRVNAASDGYEYGTPVWALYGGDMGLLFFRVSTVTNGFVDSERYLATDVRTSRLSDNKWHHLAVTAQYLEDETKTQLSLYLDRALAFRGKISGTLYSSGGNGIALGAASQHADGAITGHIDEFRISRGILPPDRFLRGRLRSLIIGFR